MDLYTNNGDKINTAALFDVIDAMEDAQKIDAGRLYTFVCDSF